MVIDSYICQFICKSCIFILSFPKQREFFLYLFSRDTGIVDGYLELAVCRDTGFAISEIVNKKKNNKHTTIKSFNSCPPLLAFSMH